MALRRPLLGGGDAGSPQAGRRLLPVLLLLTGLGLVFSAQALAFHDPFEPWPDQLRGLALRTDWGRVWVAQTGVALLLAITALAARRAEGAAATVWALLAALAVAGPAFHGHSWAVTRDRGVTLTAEVFHAWGATLWLGGLFVLVTAARRGLRGPGLGAAVARFSPLALAAVGTLVVTGGWATWVHGGGLALFTEGGWRTPWGGVLGLKLALFGAMAALGAYNWRVTLPALTEGERREAPSDGPPSAPGDPSSGAARHLVRGAAVVELALGMLIVVATALLVGLTPPE